MPHAFKYSQCSVCEMDRNGNGESRLDGDNLSRGNAAVTTYQALKYLYVNHDE